MEFFLKAVVDDWGQTSYTITLAGQIAIAVLLLALLILGNVIFGKKNTRPAVQIAFSAMAIALSTVTSMITVFKMPMGGSITLLSMLFVSLIGYWFGLGAGLATCIAYGLIQLFIDPYILSIPQLLIDYIFAFGALGLSGLVHNKNIKHGMVVGYLVAVFGRYVFSFISGWIFFGSYASYYNYNSAVVYSLVYNALYIVPEAILTVIVISIPAVKKGLIEVRRMADK